MSNDRGQTPGSFPALTPAQLERLAFLSEECGEVIKAVGKILRHGYTSSDPTIDGNDTNNREDLLKELGDVQAAITLLDCARDISGDYVKVLGRRKLKSVQQWMHHQPEALFR